MHVRRTLEVRRISLNGGVVTFAREGLSARPMYFWGTLPARPMYFWGTLKG